MDNIWKLIMIKGKRKVFEHGGDIISITELDGTNVEMKKCIHIFAKIPHKMKSYEEIINYIDDNEIWGEA